jgi:hypothetical protein
VIHAYLGSSDVIHEYLGSSEMIHAYLGSSDMIHAYLGSSDVIHAYLGSGAAAIPIIYGKGITCTHYTNKAVYEVIMLVVSGKKFLTVLMDELKEVYTRPSCIQGIHGC